MKIVNSVGRWVVETHANVFFWLILFDFESIIICLMCHNPKTARCFIGTTQKKKILFSYESHFS